MSDKDESPETTLARIEAAAGLLFDPCPHCTVRREVIALAGQLPRAVGLTHEPGCPDFIE